MLSVIKIRQKPITLPYVEDKKKSMSLPVSFHSTGKSFSLITAILEYLEVACGTVIKLSKI